MNRSLKRHRRKLSMTRQNSSPDQPRSPIGDLNQSQHSYFSLNKRKLNSSLQNLKRPLTDSEDKEEEKLPEVVNKKEISKSKNFFFMSFITSFEFFWELFK
jgi:hypothetical protein